MPHGNPDLGFMQISLDTRLECVWWRARIDFCLSDPSTVHVSSTCSVYALTVACYRETVVFGSPENWRGVTQLSIWEVLNRIFLDRTVTEIWKKVDDGGVK